MESACACPDDAEGWARVVELRRLGLAHTPPDGDERGKSLHLLGNELTALAAATNDPGLLSEAVDAYETALPLRSGEARTSTELTLASILLNEARWSHPDDARTRVERAIELCADASERSAWIPPEAPAADRKSPRFGPGAR